jgi:DNA polymerase III subunit epsilon
MKYAFVDVETTGTSSNHDRIIDIGIIVMEDGIVTKRFSTVVDPESYIAPSIFALTSISEREIKKAPPFHTIAEEVAELLKGATFVAHNARFDYAFVKRELDNAGIKFQAKCLCTVKLSRRLFPEYRKHDLSSLIERFDFKCSERHRAMPDAEVLVDFIKLC